MTEPIETTLERLHALNKHGWSEKDQALIESLLTIARELKEIKEIVAQDLADRKQREYLFDQSSIPNPDVESIGLVNLPEGFSEKLGSSKGDSL